MSTSSLPYISAHGTTGWIVRVPCAYFHDLNSKRLQYKQKLFTLEYNHRGPSAGNGRQVRVKRIRGNDLPFGITHTLRYSRQGKEQHFITVQACCNKIRRSKSFMYGHSRTREEAITKAKSTLAVFLSEIEESLDE